MYLFFLLDSHCSHVVRRHLTRRRARRCFDPSRQSRRATSATSDSIMWEPSGRPTWAIPFRPRTFARTTKSKVWRARTRGASSPRARGSIHPSTTVGRRPHTQSTSNRRTSPRSAKGPRHGSVLHLVSLRSTQECLQCVSFDRPGMAAKRVTRLNVIGQSD